jgi:hypothetical protein
VQFDQGLHPKSLDLTTCHTVPNQDGRSSASPEKEGNDVWVEDGSFSSQYWSSQSTVAFEAPDESKILNECSSNYSPEKLSCDLSPSAGPVNGGELFRSTKRARVSNTVDCLPVRKRRVKR